MKTHNHILNRFLAVFIIVPGIVILFILAYLTTYFIWHWIFTGTGFNTVIYDLSEKLRIKYPTR